MQPCSTQQSFTFVEGWKECEEGDVVREYKAMHDDNFMSSCLREDVEGKEERWKTVNKETSEEVEKGEDETVVVKKVVYQPCFR